VDLQTGEVEELPESQGMWECACSPDGSYVASHLKDSTNIAVYDVNSQSWTGLEGCRGEALVWSEDSAYLYFCDEHLSLYRVRIEDNRLEKVADFGDLGTKGPSFRESRWYTFDPEGELLALRLSGTTEIWTLDLEAP
jgi:hypothetical protein